ncbi:MAG: BACON domain-containing protein [Bacteroidales bacterium]|nr:BACON domain-containing protein [Candidatus Cacconaster equifaecalis]
MKKTLTAIAALSIVFLIASQMISCEKFILPELTVTPDTLRFGAAADSSLVKIHSNVIWSNNDNPDWISVSVDWGDTDAETFVSVAENTSTQARQAQVSIKSETIQRYIVVEQAGVIEQESQP